MAWYARRARGARDTLDASFLYMACACPDGSTPLRTALHCFVTNYNAYEPHACAHRETSAAHVVTLAMECTNARASSSRGFFVLSKDSAGMPVCTGGDAYHASIIEATNGDWRFAALSQPIGDDAPAAYWINTSAARMPGRHVYTLALSLVETPLRALQHAEGKDSRGGLRWSADGRESPLSNWLRERRCVWERVPLQQSTISVIFNSPEAETACKSMPPASTLAYRRIRRCPPGSGRCTDNQTRRRILDTSNEQRLKKRLAQGFEHVLTSSECRLRWFGEAALTRCLEGRSVLNVGSDAVDLQRGFARINRSLAAWTQVRPGATHPNVADFHRAFEKPWQQCFLARGACDVRFGASTVRTLLKRGLTEMLPEGTASLVTALSAPSPTAAPMGHLTQSGRRAKSRQDALSLMCSHDIVVFESGVEDVALPLTKYSPLRDSSLLMPACSGRPAAECAAVLPAAIRNESWRLTPLAAYRNRLHALLHVWRGCKRSKPSWRGIFKLALAPRARALRETANKADCERAQSGYSAQAHHVAVLNDVATRAVVEAGFEVFDPFAATLHASARWFDSLPAARGTKRGHKSGAAESGDLQYEIHSAEAVSDVITQSLLGQICNGG